MDNFVIKLIDIYIRINAQYDKMRYFFKKYIVTDDIKDEDISLNISTTLEEIEKEKEYSEYKNYPNPVYESSLLLRKISNEIYKFNALLFHSSVVSYNNEAYMFSAKSGTGKSTHTNLWLQTFEGAKILNDDKPFIKICDDGIYAYGSPWNGKNNLGENAKYKIKGIAIVNRNQNNFIEMIPLETKLNYFIQGVYKPSTQEALENTMKLAIAISSKIKMFNLYCNMEKDAAKVSYNAMSKE